MKRKKTKHKETDTKHVNRNETMNDVVSSRFASHVSHSSSHFTSFNTILHSLSHSFIHIACLVLLIIIIYSNTLNAPFQWDESGFIVNNPIVKNLHYFTTPSDAKGFDRYAIFISRYVGFLTFALNYRIHGLSVTGYHIVNIIIHIANTILVYFLVLLTFRTPFFRSHDSRFTSHVSQSLIAFFSAAIFAVHPLQTEAVTYVFQRLASLVAFFYLLSLVAYIQSRLALSTEHTEESFDIKKPKKLFWNARSSSRLEAPTFWLWLVLSFLSAVLAMKTKENAFTLPFVIVLYEFCFFSRLTNSRCFGSTSHDSRSLPIHDSPKVGALEARFTIHSLYRFTFLIPILLTLTIIPLTLMSLDKTAGMGTHQPNGQYIYAVFSRGEYFFTEIRVIVTYLRLLFFPVNQNLNYDYPVFTSLFDLPVLLSFIFLSALFGLAIYFIRSSRFTIRDSDPSSRFSGLFSRFTFHDSRPFRLMGFGILWFFITLSVESSIIPIPMLIDEYRMYLPSVGMIICVVTGVFLVFSHFTKSRCFGSTSHASRSSSQFTIHDSRFTVVLLVLIIAVLSVATYQRNELWGDKIRLWEDTARKSPAKATVHFTLGLHYQESNLPYKAMEQYLIAIGINPYYTDAHHNLGDIYKSLNMFDKALSEFQICVTLMPTDAEAHNNLGVIYKSLNMFDKAMEQYLIAVKFKPDYMEAHYNLGNIYLALNMPDKAIEQYLIAINLKPDFGEAHFNLGLLYYNIGQMENARRELITGLKIDPTDQKARQLLKAVNR